MFDLAMITDHLPKLIASDAELWQDICVVNVTFPIYTCGSEAWFTASNPMYPVVLTAQFQHHLVGTKYRVLTIVWKYLFKISLYCFISHYFHLIN